MTPAAEHRDVGTDEVDADGDFDGDEEGGERALEIGGYAEARATWTETGGGNPFVGEATLRRVAIELEHEFRGLPLSSEIELEWENALACNGCAGSIEAEEAFVEWSATDRVRVDAGLLLVPFGWLNLDHEPRAFWSVDRPQVDQLIVPTTWRELGVGLRTVGRVRARAALLTTPDPTRLGTFGLAPAEGFGSKVRANGAAGVARVEADLVEGVGVAASVYGADLGHDGDFYDSGGERVRLFLPLAGAEADARATFGPLTVRGEAATFSFPDAEVLLATRHSDGSPYFADGSVVPTRWWGGYVEGGLDVLSLLDQDAHLTPFARIEAYDGTSAVPKGTRRDPGRNAVDWTFGAAFEPWDPLVIKADVDLRDYKLGLDDRILQLGIGWVF